MENWRNLAVDRVCNAACLGLGEGPVTQQTVSNCLQRIGGKPIIYNNYFRICKEVLLSISHVNVFVDITVTRDTANLGMSRK